MTTSSGHHSDWNAQKCAEQHDGKLGCPTLHRLLHSPQVCPNAGHDEKVVTGG